MGRRCHHAGRRRIVECWLLACILLAKNQISLQITQACDHEKQFEHLGKCCMKCEPGRYMAAKCTGTSETLCLPCGPEQYLDTWNEEEKCQLQKPCDPGQGLVVVNLGNSTLQRKCACIRGYHLNRDYEFCKKNTECGPGFGVEQPPGEASDTACKPCADGQFSNISSFVEKCQPWTNCTTLGKAEKAPGSNFSDAVCEGRNSPANTGNPADDGEKLFHIVALLLLFAAVSLASTVVLICCRKKVKTLTVNLQRWADEICSRGDKEKCCGSFNNPHLKSIDLHLSDGMLNLIEKGLSQHDLCCANRHVGCADVELQSSCSESEDTPFSSATDSEEDQPQRIPIEDEYVHPGHQRYNTASGNLQRCSAPLFPQPVEVGYNDGFSQCFMGTENLDSEGSHGSEFFCGADCMHVSSCSSVQGACTCNGLFDNVQDTNVSFDICPVCKHAHRNQKEYTGITNNISSEVPGYECSPDYTCQSDYAPVEKDTNCVGGNPLFDSSGTRKPGTDRSASQASGSSSCWSPVTPTPSGNVTGNSNSTFISSGQVMNFKGDVIVVYVSQNSQEAPAGTGATAETVGNPVQEENQCRCDTFVGNTQQTKEKCAQVPAEEEVPSASWVFETFIGPVVQEGPTGVPHACHSTPTAAPLPVQEEGKPGTFLQ